MSELSDRIHRYWVEQDMRPRTEEGRRRLARANYWWAEAEEASERQAAEARRRNGTEESEDFDDLPADERARRDRAHAEWMRRTYPPGSKVHELGKEVDLAARMVDELTEQLERFGWSDDRDWELQEWRMRLELARLRRQAEMDQDRKRRWRDRRR